MRKQRRRNVSKTNLGIKNSSSSRAIYIITFLLTIIGLIVIADSSAPMAVRSYSDKYHFVKQQTVWALAGSASFFIFSRINYRFWEKYATLIFFAGLLMLLMVFVPGVGVVTNGARRWLIIAGNRLQPSEFVKLSILIYVAKLASKKKGMMSYLVTIFLVCALIMLQPDLGTTMVIATSAFIQMFISGVSLIKFLAISLVGGGISLFLILFSDYRRARLMTFLSQTQDSLGEGYHIRQILFALGSGGIWGVGFGESKQKYLFLPATATDSIFAVIAEELGFLGAFVIIILFCIYIYFGFKIAVEAKDTFSKVLAAGIVSWIGIQTVFNLGSMVALVPLTGIPLPFVSYGGSALLASLTASGILLNISRKQ